MKSIVPGVQARFEGHPEQLRQPVAKQYRVAADIASLVKKRLRAVNHAVDKVAPLSAEILDSLDFRSRHIGDVSIILKIRKDVIVVFRIEADAVENQCRAGGNDYQQGDENIQHPRAKQHDRSPRDAHYTAAQGNMTSLF